MGLIASPVPSRDRRERSGACDCVTLLASSPMIRLFKVSIPSSAVVLVISDAVLLFSCYLFAAWLTIDIPLVKFLFEQSGYWHIAFVMGVIMLVLYFNDLYEDYQVSSRIELIQQFCLAVGIAFLLQSLVSYAQWGVLLPKYVMVYGSVLALIILPLWRMFFTALASSSLGAQKLLFLGVSPAVREIASYLKEHPEFGLASVGYLEGGYLDSASEIPGMKRLGSIAQLDEVLAEQQPSRVVVGLDPLAPASLPVERLLELRLGGLEIEEASATYEMVFRRVSTRDMPPSHLIFSQEMSPRPAGVALKSTYSLVLGLVAFLVTLPVMAMVAMIVKFTSGGPVMQREQCAGLNGTQFAVLKFRSTAKWLRRLRLDELPQLFNVVRGEMAIVGPRPERPEFAAVLEEEIPYYRQRLCVKPGITGWAQINEKGGAIEDTIQKLEFDRYYIKNLSLALDAYIMFHALKTTLLGR
jgi:lipopolysaccharide/colanic/teichoic acid biosynthesis glycosyltransferase